MSKLQKVAVLGGGSFGTVLANLAASNGYKVSLWVRDSEQALRINSEGANTSYHPELKLSENILASEDLSEVVKNVSIVFIATPSIIPKKEKIEIIFKNPSFFLGLRFLNVYNLSVFVNKVLILKFRFNVL